MSEIWTVRRLLTWTTQHFEKRGVDAPRLTTEILLAHTLLVDRVRLYVDLDRPLELAELSTFRGLLQRRVQGEPTQYLTGHREFYKRSFKVDARVLIPRPETELLVDAVLLALPKASTGRIVDLCTGSGCIAVSVLAERPLVTAVATDVSAGALALTRENADGLGVGERLELRVGDLTTVLKAGEAFDVVVANPPYIATAEIATLSAEVRCEPTLALDGGTDGLQLIRRLVQGAKDFLRPGGLLAFEIGETQGPATLELLLSAGYQDARIDRDFERRNRMAFGTRPAAAETHR